MTEKKMIKLAKHIEYRSSVKFWKYSFRGVVKERSFSGRLNIPNVYM